jgi:hypothetical protein
MTENPGGGRANAQEPVLAGFIQMSDRAGYIRLFTSRNGQDFYDFPAEWFRGLNLDRAAPTRAGARPAFRQGNDQAPVTFDDFVNGPAMTPFIGRGSDPIFGRRG